MKIDCVNTDYNLEWVKSFDTVDMSQSGYANNFSLVNNKHTGGYQGQFVSVIRVKYI